MLINVIYITDTLIIIGNDRYYGKIDLKLEHMKTWAVNAIGQFKMYKNV